MTKLLALSLLLSLSACTDSPDDPVLPSVPICSLDGQVGCVARADFPAVDKANLVASAASFKTGNTFAGVAGTMADCAADNGIACIATTDFPSVVKAEITAASVVSGSTLAGVTGSFAPPCTMDAQTDCLTTSVFKAVNLPVIDAWDIRVGKTLAGVDGSSTFYTSAATLTTFNRTTGDGSSNSTSIADYYDSIDDNANNLAIPVLVPPAAPQIVSNWIRETETDADADQSCNGTETCVYTDLLTGLSWLADNSMTYLWEAAISYCDGLSISGHDDWRLPTQKELMQAYVNRIWGIKAPLGLVSTGYFTATTVSILTTHAWNLTLGTGLAIAQIKASDPNHVLCVR